MKGGFFWLPLACLARQIRLFLPAAIALGLFDS
jgi:hypothetical protein